jgi:hypothetical protein
MDAKFDELVKKRKKWVESSKENRFDFESILAGLYNDPSHFIYELLQNAEDEGATEVRFEVFKDRIDFYHNGKDFDLEDIDGVTGIGISKKKDDLNLIGKFGVGFKSVFAITETPYIFSGMYRIKIEDFVVPTLVDNNDEKINGTLIRLPFNHRKRSPEEIFELTSKRLENLGLKTMLFLRNIEEIQWKTPFKSGHYLKEIKWINPKVRKVTAISSTTMEEYLIVEKPIEIEGKTLKVEVAYKLSKDKSGKEIIIPEPDSKLVVYFPTEKVTYLNFLIHGPYKTTPNRENIPLEDEQNKAILEQTASLVGESLLIIKELGHLDVNFLNILPIRPENKEKELIYLVIYDEVREKLSTDELLPTHDNKYAKANDVLLARGKELTEFLDNDDINLLFGKQYWLDTNITQDKTPELREYLIKELNVPEVDFESFARRITAEFLERKSDEWMINFYTKLLDQQTLWTDRPYRKGILRTKPIIRLENGQHIAPYDEDGKIQVYLPEETKTKYKTVKRSLVKDENALKFLKELGLRKPGLFAEIKEFIIPKYQRENSTKDDEYFEDFIKFLKAYKKLPEKEKKELIESLSNIAFIDAVKTDTGESSLRKPSEVYLKDDNLIKYFEGYPVWFVSDELYEKFGQELNTFLKAVGVEDKPRKKEIPGNLTEEEKERLRGFNGCTYEIYQKDYEYEGLDNLINNITPEKSYLLWKFLLQNIKNLSSWEAEEFFQGKYSWFYYSQHYRSFEAKFLKTLKKHPWLIDKNNNFRKPSEITFSELSDSYIKNGPNIDILKEVLGFKPEIIDQLPEEDRRILELARKHGLTFERLEQLLQQNISSSEPKEELQEKEGKHWTPECSPEEAVKRIEDYEPEKISTPDLIGQSENIVRQSLESSHKEETTEDKSQNKKAEKETKEIAPADSRSIGRWGEEYVFECLKEEYQKQGDLFETDNGFIVKTSDGEDYEIVWLNKYQDKGKGCDFIIKKNGMETEYIEVKAKRHEDEELIEVTGTQWEFARSLYDKNEGDKYFFFVVMNAGEKDNVWVRRIQNPIKLWKEGKLYAHPVNFKL